MTSSLLTPIRLARFFYTQRVVGFDVPDEPHFDPLSTPRFLDLLSRSKSYLEFGAGGSTVVAAKLGIPTVTVENDCFFAAATQKRIGTAPTHCILVYDIGLTGPWGKPVLKSPTPRRVRRWRRYVEGPFEVLETFPDLVLVDGRFRRACALKTAEQAWKCGAYLTLCVDDYSDRPYYHSIEEFLGRPEMVGRMALFQIGLGVAADVGRAIEEAVTDFR